MTTEILEGKSRDSDDGKAKLQKFKDRMAKRGAKAAAKDDANEEVQIDELKQAAGGGVYNGSKSIKTPGNGGGAPKPKVKQKVGAGIHNGVASTKNPSEEIEGDGEVIDEITQDEIDNPDFAHNLLVNAIGEKPGEFNTIFQDAIRDRISGKVADRKLELASSILGVEEPDQGEEIQGPEENPAIGEPDDSVTTST